MVAKDEHEAELPDLIPEPREGRGVGMRLVLALLTVVFVALGIIGWLIPVVTGVPFYVLAAITAGMASRRVARWINARERRLPLKWRRRLRPKLWREWRRKLKEEETETGRGGRG